MQDGFVFTDTIARNIAFADEEIDMDKLEKAAIAANIQEHILSLPDSYQTVLGTEINSLSQGQKQRLLIARAIYKNGDYFFLDEPTSALDSKNERIIMNNLLEVFKGKTVLMVAHKLSSIVHADRIIVLEKGEIAESGTHTELLESKGLYYEFIQSQYA